MDSEHSELISSPTLRYSGDIRNLMTSGSLPQAYRTKFSQHIPWDTRKQRKFDSNRKRIRRLFNLMPAQWRLMPEARQRLHNSSRLQPKSKSSRSVTP